MGRWSLRTLSVKLRCTQNRPCGSTSGGERRNFILRLDHVYRGPGSFTQEYLFWGTLNTVFSHSVLYLVYLKKKLGKETSVGGDPSFENPPKTAPSAFLLEGTCVLGVLARETNKNTIVLGYP